MHKTSQRAVERMFHSDCGSASHSSYRSPTRIKCSIHRKRVKRSSFSAADGPPFRLSCLGQKVWMLGYGASSSAYLDIDGFYALYPLAGNSATGGTWCWLQSDDGFSLFIGAAPIVIRYREGLIGSLKWKRISKKMAVSTLRPQDPNILMKPWTLASERWRWFRDVFWKAKQRITSTLCLSRNVTPRRRRRRTWRWCQGTPAHSFLVTYLRRKLPGCILQETPY